jgi:hypothetical protein
LRFYSFYICNVPIHDLFQKKICIDSFHWNLYSNHRDRHNYILQISRKHALKRPSFRIPRYHISIYSEFLLRIIIGNSRDGVKVKKRISESVSKRYFDCNGVSIRNSVFKLFSSVLPSIIMVIVCNTTTQGINDRDSILNSISPERNWVWGFVICMVGVYILAPDYIRRYQAVRFNLSILTQGIF